MNEDKIVVTLTSCVQVGPNDFESNRISRVFSTSRTVDEMLKWAASEGYINPRVTDLSFSLYTGESI